MTKRRKLAPVEAPKTLDEAIGCVVRYVEIDTGLEKLEADAKEAIAKIKAVHDATAEPLKQEMNTILARLRNWWAVAADVLTDGKRKSHQLAGCTIGLRWTPPKVSCKGRTDALAAVALNDAGLVRFIRVTIAPDKEAIYAALANQETDEQKALAKQLKDLGFSFSQREEFFVARPQSPAVETIAEPRKEAA